MCEDNQWQNVFCGREKELQFLIDKWKLVADSITPEPQIAIILGESGFGKTRLIQEFYSWLSENEDEVQYWPRRLGNIGDNLKINPLLEEFSEQEKSMPYLWWGLRCADPAGHNSQIVSTLSAYLDFFALHLQPLYQTRFNL